MRILLTGASSFTGMWFARALAQAGHTVIAPVQHAENNYHGIRAERINILKKYATIVWSCSFGDGRFMELVADGNWDRLCHHAAQVGDYRSMNFDIASALAHNTRNLENILCVMQEKGLKAVVLTGSVFEAHEGKGETQSLEAFSPYGVSKGLTYETFLFWCQQKKIPLMKFVIPNPFGPYEEPRFCNYLLQCWRERKTAVVKTPAYVRDNIHISLLATCYVEAVRCAPDFPFQRIGPSEYAETQGDFAQRFANEIGGRLKMNCPLELAQQTEFAEPRMRVNITQPNYTNLKWNESEAWDELAAYYQSQI